VKKLDLVTLRDVPSNTSPGLVFKRMGFKTKADAFDHAQRIANKTKHFVGKGIANPCFRPVWGLASRSHLVLRSQEKVRVIWVCPLDHLLLEGTFALPLIEAYKLKDNPIAWDYSIFGGKYWAESVKFNKGTDQAMNIDFSAFDESVPPWLINIAFDILKSNLDFTTNVKRSAKWMKIFEYVRSCFIKTKFQTADGDMYVKNGGIPSGSWFTQLVGSICNFIAITYANIKAYGIIPDTLKVLGDDSLSIYKENQNVNVCINDLVPWLSKLGLSASESKTLYSKDLEEISFLGHQFRVDGPPYRPISTLLLLLLYPETPDTSWIDAGKRALGITYDAMSWHKHVWRICRVLVSAANKESYNYKEEDRKQILLNFSSSQLRFYKYNLGIDAPNEFRFPDEEELFMRGWLGLTSYSL
jgi:hypothetical protein